MGRRTDGRDGWLDGWMNDLFTSFMSKVGGIGNEHAIGICFGWQAKDGKSGRAFFGVRARRARTIISTIHVSFLFLLFFASALLCSQHDLHFFFLFLHASPFFLLLLQALLFPSHCSLRLSLDSSPDLLCFLLLVITTWLSWVRFLHSHSPMHERRTKGVAWSFMVFFDLARGKAI
ncbi:hypothetical protein BGZ63DRAFT_372381 [Mariannaea sp. PMI_226]|nr:hypothetical protein BGZ63DRAFT_372381 [Mariannaea sp. PMI_226]